MEHFMLLYTRVFLKHEIFKFWPWQNDVWFGRQLAKDEVPCANCRLGRAMACQSRLWDRLASVA